MPAGQLANARRCGTRFVDITQSMLVDQRLFFHQFGTWFSSKIARLRLALCGLRCRQVHALWGC
jgi:hypothetical protein